MKETELEKIQKDVNSNSMQLTYRLITRLQVHNINDNIDPSRQKNRW